MSEETLRISANPPERTSMSYAALREGGMERVRWLAKETWTDHNVHDPGVTVLEALSYAMTELGFRIQLDVPDLLRSGETHGPAQLVPAHRALPTAPITPEDLRKVLLDHDLVGDAWVRTGAEGEVPFYQDPGADPPFTYLSGTAAVRPKGLYEVMVELAERDWNSNTYSIEVSSGGTDYALDLALPHWDEDEAVPFREAVTLDTVTLVDPGSGPWRPLEEAQTYFGQIRIDYTGPGGPATIEIWAILRITSVLDQPALVTPGILTAATTAIEAGGPGSLIEGFAERVRAAYGAVERVQRYLATWRNLGEEPVRLAVARIQEIGIRARIEVTGSTDLERLLAEVLLAIDNALSPPVRFHFLEALRTKGRGAEEIYDGPLLRQGFLDDVELDSLNRQTLIYASDVLRLIMRERGAGGGDLVAQENPTGRDIVAVTDLGLSNFVNNRPITTDASDCLRLVEVERYRPRLSLSKSRIIFVRNDVEVSYDLTRVATLLAELQAQARALDLPADPSPVWPVPRGEALPVEDYFPFQNDLPRIYGVGEAGLPESADTERKARALQMKGYLYPFEQILADITAQIGNVNRFFSPAADERATYFTRALFDLPGADRLLRRFQPGDDWEAFVTDPANPHRIALQAAAEDRERFLDRRNRMLDHLLARHGEEAVAWGQELHRWAQRELVEAGVPAPALPDRMQAQRQAVNARLIQDKAGWLADLPELNGARLRAFGNPLQSRPDVLVLEAQATGYGWRLTLEGQSLLRSTETYATAGAAVTAAEEAVVLAAQPDFYGVVPAGGGRRRYQLREGADASARVLGESIQTWTTVAATQTALQAAAAQFRTLRLAESLTPMERRIAHLTGVRSRVRRPLISPTDAFFEIYDEVDADAAIEKRWRLWSLPSFGGNLLLSSVFHFEAPTDPEAVALAQASIDQVLRYGTDTWNYQGSPAGPSTFNFELQSPAGTVLGLGNPPLPSPEAVEQGIAATADHLYRLYSAEGFHLVEHLLLRPRQVGDPFLVLPEGETGTVLDPYSQRLSLVLPSGYARDFSLDAAAAPRTPVPPHRFRDPEFRRHLERMTQQACPAHLLPALYWVDREAPGTPSSPASFEAFEERYLDWIESVLVPGAPEATVTLARAGLVLALNAIANA